MPTKENPPSGRKVKSTRRTLRRIITLLVIALLVQFHSHVFRAIGHGLVVEEPFDRADVAVIFDGDGRFEKAASMVEAGAVQQVLLTNLRPQRLVHLGIMPSDVDMGRHWLVELEIPEEQIARLDGDFAGDWHRHRKLKSWLNDHPDDHAVVLCEQFKSRWTRWILDRILDAEDQRRVRVVGLADRNADASNWWRKRNGWKMVFDAYFDLGSAVLRGEDEPPPIQLDLDEYEAQIVRRWIQLD